MNFEISVPSKTFLLGEYLATQGGTAVIANTNPRFVLEVSIDKALPSNLIGISETSPAGKFYLRHKEAFKNISLNFTDPHNGKGGLGASSAQYALLISLFDALKKSRIKAIETDIKKYFSKFDPIIGFQYLDEYISDSWNNEGLRPSGTDMIAQLSGQIAVVSTNTSCLSSHTWDFKNLSFILVRTGAKLATHEHLKTVGAIPASLLQRVCNRAIESLETINEKTFLVSVKAYAENLKHIGILAEHSDNLLKQICSNKNVLAAKGCGAMGADILLILFAPENKTNIVDHISSLNLEIIADNKSLTSGLMFAKTESKIATKSNLKEVSI